MSDTSEGSFFERYERIQREVEELHNCKSASERAMVQRAIDKLISEVPEFEEMRREHEQKYLAERPLMVSFLASLLSNKMKQSIRAQVDADPEHFLAIQHMFLGMWLRNQLRRVGFQYDPLTLDSIWSGLLVDALDLPEDKMKLSLMLRLKLHRMKMTDFIKRHLTKLTMLVFASVALSGFLLAMIGNIYGTLIDVFGMSCGLLVLGLLDA